MNICKLLIFNTDELNIIQCRSENPASFVVMTEELTEELIDNAVAVRLEWYAGEEFNICAVSIKEYDGTKALLIPVSECHTSATEQYHMVAMSDPLFIEKAAQDSIIEYRHKADSLNRHFKNSITAQMKQVITDESVTNQLILKMLIQIDSKLDELLAIKAKEASESMSQTRFVYLSGSDIAFITDDASAGEIFFVRSDAANNPGLAFAAICKVFNVIKTGRNSICEATFIHMDETTRDSVIHYVFEKDREKLKRKKING